MLLQIHVKYSIVALFLLSLCYFISVLVSCTMLAHFPSAINLFIIRSLHWSKKFWCASGEMRVCRPITCWSCLSRMVMFQCKLCPRLPLLLIIYIVGKSLFDKTMLLVVLAIIGDCLLQMIAVNVLDICNEGLLQHTRRGLRIVHFNSHMIMSSITLVEYGADRMQLQCHLNSKMWSV